MILLYLVIGVFASVNGASEAMRFMRRDQLKYNPNAPIEQSTYWWAALCGTIAGIFWPFYIPTMLLQQFLNNSGNERK